MKTLLITLPMFLTIAACGAKDTDTGAEDDEFTIDGESSSEDADDASDDDASGGGDVMNAVPACDLAGAMCYSFDGPLWAGQNIQSVCGQLSAQYEAEGLPPMSYLAAGCPAGAIDECSGVLMGADESGNPVDGSDVTIYNYQAASSSQLSASCSGEMGGTYATL